MWPYTIQNIFLYSIKKYLFLMTLIIKKREKEKPKQTTTKNKQKHTDSIHLTKHLTKHKEK